MQPLSYYIAGAGSFASLTLKMLTDTGVVVQGFIDEIATGTKESLPIYSSTQIKATVQTSSTCVLIAISQEKHQEAARSRLIVAGVDPLLILNLESETSLTFLRTLHQEGIKLPELLQIPLSDIPSLEQRITQLKSTKAVGKKSLISFNFYAGGCAGGGGFRQHVNPLAEKLTNHYEVISYSDETDLAGDNSIQLQLQSNLSAVLNNTADLAITPHFIPCSAPSVCKVTFMHVIYDYCLFEDVLYKSISQPKRHYIFTSSRPAFNGMKQLLLDGDYKNEVILIPGGYPRLDYNRLKLQQMAGALDTLVYAPTASVEMPDKTELTYSIYQASAILEALVQAFPSYRIVFRPHPKDLSRVRAGKNSPTADAIRAAIEYCQHSRCELDASRGDYLANYGRAAVLISDTSSTAFTFALTTKRPVVFFSPGNHLLKEQLGHFDYIQDREHFGVTVSDVNSLLLAIATMLENPGQYAEKILQHSKQILFNDGCSEDYFINNISYILNNNCHPDWWYLRDNQKQIG